ncbi:MAG: hypothetical protein DSY33_05090 [Archaeoglobus sp.]|jgi:acetyl-CoA decarbonylase/synthase complex subunit beta|nr:MAG: hypothetical protein DSY33_05090 [Archaeoglobus sp.]
MYFLCCISCQNKFPGHFCIISPDRPSPCGITYREALSRIEFFKKVEVGRKVGVDEYEGLNEFVRRFGCERIKLHSVRNYPHPTSPLQQIIAFYIPKEGIGLVDRKFSGKTPLGLTFTEMEILSAGRQVDGFTGVSYAYLKRKEFLLSEGGLKSVVWMSPKIRKFVMQL